VHLGGHLGSGGDSAQFGRKVRGLKVTADGAVDFIERLLRSYLDSREPDEPVSAWLRRVDEGVLVSAAEPAAGPPVAAVPG
jgi:sulfite reductase (ferredoxin)